MHGMEVRIRPATSSDLPILVRLLDDLFSIEADFTPNPDAQRDGLALMLADPRHRRVLVAERGGAVVGMVTGQLLVSTAEGGYSVLVEDMVVERAVRGHGIGRRLLDALEGWAVEQGATRLQLLADRENAPALAFYDRAGWRSTQLVCMCRHPARPR
jgi:GNAT superfamily N-acetyltransferase